MISSNFLVGQTEEYNKSFKTVIPAKSLFNVKDQFKINQEIIIRSAKAQQFNFSEGKVELSQSNDIFYLEYIPCNIDIVLPIPNNVLSWVVLLYNIDNVLFDVSYDHYPKIKLYGNGKRIMGLNEPMICDIPFSSLKLTFVDEVNGWIVT